jgi:hypothetical protein
LSNLSDQAKVSTILAELTEHNDDAVVELTEKANIKSLSTYINSPHYFVGKIQCSSDKYDFDFDYAKKWLIEQRDYRLEGVDDEDKIENINNVFADIIEYAKNEDWSNVTYSEEYENLSEIDNDCWEWIGDVGKVIHCRVIMWLVGLQMAYEQLNKENKLSYEKEKQ